MRRCIITQGGKKGEFHIIFEESTIRYKAPSSTARMVEVDEAVPSYLVKAVVKAWVEDGVVKDKVVDDNIPF